jgi:hypothetical protein
VCWCVAGICIGRAAAVYSLMSLTRCGVSVSGSVKNSGHVVHVTTESLPKNNSDDAVVRDDSSGSSPEAAAGGGRFAAAAAARTGGGADRCTDEEAAFEEKEAAAAVDLEEADLSLFDDDAATGGGCSLNLVCTPPLLCFSFCDFAVGIACRCGGG